MIKFGHLQQKLGAPSWFLGDRNSIRTVYSELFTVNEVLEPLTRWSKDAPAGERFGKVEMAKIEYMLAQWISVHLTMASHI